MDPWCVPPGSLGSHGSLGACGKRWTAVHPCDPEFRAMLGHPWSVEAQKGKELRDVLEVSTNYLPFLLTNSVNWPINI